MRGATLEAALCTSVGVAQETELLAPDLAVAVDLVFDTTDLRSFSLSFEKVGRWTASMEFPSKSITAAE